MIIGVSGFAQAGKDEIGKCLVKHFGFERMALADPVRDMVYAINPAVAELVDMHGWERAKTAFPYVREAIVSVGLGAREVIGPDVWLSAMVRKMRPGTPYVVTDVRFPNEFHFCQEYGEMWRVDRLGGVPANDGESENLLTDYVFDRRFKNFGSVRDLCDAVATEMYHVDQAEAYEDGS